MHSNREMLWICISLFFSNCLAGTRPFISQLAESQSSFLDLPTTTCFGGYDPITEKVYILGGVDWWESPFLLNTVQTIDPNTGQISLENPLSTPTASGSQPFVSGKTGDYILYWFEDYSTLRGYDMSNQIEVSNITFTGSSTWLSQGVSAANGEDPREPIYCVAYNGK